MLSVAAWGWQASPAGAQGASPYPNLPAVPAQSAQSFGDSVGVNVHLLFGGSSYDRFDVILARLRELGVRHVRDGLCAPCQSQIARLQTLAAAGIRANLIAGDLKGGAARMNENLEAIGSRLRHAAASVEAPNEPDVEAGVSDWIAATRVYQQQLYARVKGDSRLAHLPVLGPAVVHHANWPLLGDLSSFLDRGNMHPYPGGGTPLHNLDDERRHAAPVSGSKPLVATEAGYHSDLATTSGHHPTSERADRHLHPAARAGGFSTRRRAHLRLRAGGLVVGERAPSARDLGPGELVRASTGGPVAQALLSGASQPPPGRGRRLGAGAISRRSSLWPRGSAARPSPAVAALS